MDAPLLQIVLFCCVSFCRLAEVVLAEEWPATDEPNLLFVGFRHGNRNPGRFLPDDPNQGKWHLEGDSALTAIGKQQAYVLGQLLRSRYGKFIPEEYFPSQIVAQSSTADRCQHTTQCVLAGMFPPKGFDVWNNEMGSRWQPVSIALNDPLLRMYNINPCKGQVDAWQPATDDKLPEQVNLTNTYRQLIDFVAGKSKFEANLNGMADVADNLEGILIRNLTMPSWVTSDNPFNRNIYEDIHKFAENHQKCCAAYEPCRKMMAGYWLNDILNQLQKQQNKTQKGKVFVYGTHNEIVTSLLWCFGSEKDGIYYNGAAILEYRDLPAAVRLVVSEPTEFDPNTRSFEMQTMPFCGGEQWCPLEKFKEGVQKYVITDWEKACQRDVCFCVPPPSSQTKAAVPI